jgi:hypothetical protein
VNIAEPNALIGFAGARVSAGTIAQELPPGFQRSEFLFEHGYLDRVVHRSELRAEFATLLRYLVARPVAAAIEAPDGDPLGLPSFRPLSFLSNLAERVLPTETEMNGPSNGHPAPERSAPERSAPERQAPAPDRPTRVRATPAAAEELPTTNVTATSEEPAPGAVAGTAPDHAPAETPEEAPRG